MRRTFFLLLIGGLLPLLLAPWVSADYCGVAHEKASENKEAIASFSLYPLATMEHSDLVAKDLYSIG